MRYMFCNCYKFNQPLKSWNVSNCINFGFRFYNCHEFKQILNDWDVSIISDDNDMFLRFEKCEGFPEWVNI